MQPIQFIRRKLIEHSQVRLGTSGDMSGVGEAFVLTNPRLRDHPIVSVSPKFCEMTGRSCLSPERVLPWLSAADLLLAFLSAGYSKEAIVGRKCDRCRPAGVRSTLADVLPGAVQPLSTGNCRFLQGPGTAPASVQRLRDALNEGEEITELLLNCQYNATSRRFYLPPLTDLGLAHSRHAHWCPLLVRRTRPSPPGCASSSADFSCARIDNRNLLCMIPLRSSTGSLVYVSGARVLDPSAEHATDRSSSHSQHISSSEVSERCSLLTSVHAFLMLFISRLAGQINVTGSISNTSRLSFLVGGEASSSLAEGSAKLNPLQFSPTLRKEQPALVPSDSGSVIEHHAAGSVAARGIGAGTIDGSEFGSTSQEIGGFEPVQRTSTARGAPSSWTSSGGGGSVGGAAGKRLGKLLSRFTSQRRADKPDQVSLII